MINIHNYNFKNALTSQWVSTSILIWKKKIKISLPHKLTPVRSLTKIERLATIRKTTCMILDL